MTRVAAALAVVVLLAGCHGAAKPGGLRYLVRGVVESVDPAAQEIALKSEEIPGFMAAMTMEYKVTDPAAVQEMHPGDRISATLLADGTAEDATNMRLADVVVLTFIYTRCPLADYCPRMSHNFAEIDRALAADPKLYARTHLLSVSFDPAYDTPAVLKSYGGAYTGKYMQETFTHWEFAAPPAAELEKMEQWFDVGVTPGPGNSLQHSLSTVVVGKDGKVVAFWPTNDWSVDEVLAKVKAAA